MRKECFICGRRGQGVEEHHAVPQRRGGSDSPENLYPLCGSCHNAVEKIYDDAFYERLGLAEARVEAFERADGEIEGRKVDRERSHDRPLPPDSPHVIYELTDADGVQIHCGYCSSVFERYEHALAAQHLRISHRIEDPYERESLDELAATRRPRDGEDGLTVGLPDPEPAFVGDDREQLQSVLDRL